MSAETSMAVRRAQPDLDWRGAVPVSRRYGDPYYAPDDGLAEARHVFLGGNRLPERARDGFLIAELGFGTGLNLLAAWELWRALGTGILRFVSFEAHPLPVEALARAHAPWPKLAPLAEALRAAWRPDGDRLSARLDGLDLEVRFGDARALVPAAKFRADAWFLDGFAPARNPGMWEPGLLAAVARATAPGGTAATFSAAGAVRRGLAAASFAVERRPGFGRKRHMTAALLKE